MSGIDSGQWVANWYMVPATGASTSWETLSSWTSAMAWPTALVVHRAPLNTDCEKDADPDANCEFEILDTPSDWTSSDFDDSAWTTATVWSENDVSPKDGYDEITWHDTAQLVWGDDLEVDNTVLLRVTVG